MSFGRTFEYVVLLTFWIVPASVACAACPEPLQRNADSNGEDVSHLLLQSGHDFESIAFHP
jgi:hypothetical protein